MNFISVQIFRIVNDGFKSVRYDVDGNLRSNGWFVVEFVLCPMVTGLLFWKYHVNLSFIVDTLLSVLSIFTALIFSLLFIVPDKLSQRLERIKYIDDESAKNYLIRFCNYTKLFVQQISFMIVISLILIFLLVILKISVHDSSLLINFLPNISVAINKECVLQFSLYGKILNFLCGLMLYYFIIYLLYTLSNTYVLLVDDINRCKNKINKYQT